MAAGWFAEGKTLGVAVDLDAGRMLVSVDVGDWAEAFPTGCAPSAAAGAGLFPALSGNCGARIQCNWGADAGRPMRHGPPSADYRAVGLARQQALPPHPLTHTRHAHMRQMSATQCHGSPQPLSGAQAAGECRRLSRADHCARVA